MSARAAVVLLTNSLDFAIDPVVDALGYRGVEVQRLNADVVASRPVPRISLDDPGIELPFVLIRRQFEFLYTGDTVADYDNALLQRAQWRAWAEGLESWARAAVNPLSNARRAENKIVQLRVAQRVGMCVPKTFITNDPTAVDGTPHSLIVKSLSGAFFEGSDQSFVFTHHLTPELVAVDPREWHAQPVIVQREIKSHTHVRVITFDGQSSGALIESDTLDWRLQDSASWEAWEVPSALHARCEAYLAEFGLWFGAFDFVVDGDTAWFLEANQAGEWWFIDRTCNLGILERYVNFVTELCLG